MAYATTADINDDGWRADQFGGAVADWPAYVTRVIDDAAAWAGAKMGSAYAGLTGYALACARNAERLYVGAVLSRRRAAFFDSAAVGELAKVGAAERRGYVDDSGRLMELAHAHLRDAMNTLGVSTESLNDAPAFAVGHIETGLFPPTSTEALNV